MMVQENTPTKRFKPTYPRRTVLWLAALGVMLLLIALRGAALWLVLFPEDWFLPVVSRLNTVMAWIVDYTRAFFRVISAALDIPMSAVRDFLGWSPWSVSAFAFAFVVVANAAVDLRLAIFSVFAIGYMLVVGLWTDSMNSLALVSISVPLAVATGFAIGTLGFLYRRAERSILFGLDALQTIPAFAYLLPILVLFGFGAVVGLIAGILFAFPPMVRNTMLGLRRVASEVIEPELMSGATPAQLFFRVREPSASRQIMLGVNQTTMAAFSMVIIASIVGGSSDIECEVLSALRKARFGESLVAGLVIALMAILMDRITAGFANKAPSDVDPAALPFVQRHRIVLFGIIGALALFPACFAFPSLRSYPNAWVIDPSGSLNSAIHFIIIEYAAWIALIKK